MFLDIVAMYSAHGANAYATVDDIYNVLLAFVYLLRMIVLTLTDAACVYRVDRKLRRANWMALTLARMAETLACNAWQIPSSVLELRHAASVADN